MDHLDFITWVEYGLVNIAAGTAIAIDACVLIILMFRTVSSHSLAIRWAGAVGSTHIAFPMVGFVGGWILVDRYNLALFVYAFGAGLIAILLWVIVREGLNSIATTEQTSSRFHGAGGLHFWVPVLFVSLDALLSGPGKTVILDRYPSYLTWFSFAVVGITVALLTFAAGELSYTMNRYWLRGRMSSAISLGRAVSLSILAEIVLFSFFLSWGTTKALEQFSDALSIHIPLYTVAGLGVILSASIWAFWGRPIRRVQLLNAQWLLKRD